VIVSSILGQVSNRDRINKKQATGLNLIVFYSMNYSSSAGADLPHFGAFGANCAIVGFYFFENF
jgi:hypothetical protein